MGKNIRTPRRSKSLRADLVFPVSRTYRKLKEGRYCKRIGVGGAIYLAAVLEYLVAEISELAGNCCKQHKKKLVSPRHIYLAVHGDDELQDLLGRVTISQGGVVPNIHSSLLKKSKRKSQARNSK